MGRARAYVGRVAAFDRDLRLFMAYGLCSYLGIGVFALMFNLYLVELGYDEAFIGAFNAVNTLTMGLTCIAIGFLINRFGCWACLVWGTLEFVLASVALSFVQDSAALLALAALNGVGQAFILTAQMPFVIEWTPRQLTSTAAALSSSINSASVMLGSLLGGVLPALLAMPFTFSAQSVPAYQWTLVAGVGLTGLGLLPLLAMRTARHEKHHADFHVARAQLLSRDARRQARRDVSTLFLLGLLLALGVGAIEPFYNVLLGDMGWSASRIGLVFALSSLAATVASLAGPALFRWLGAVRSQLLTRLMHVPFHLALIVFPHPALLSLATASRRVSGATAWPIESAHVGGLLPPAARAHAFGLRSASWNLGYALAAFVSGVAIARTGSYLPAYLAMGLFSTLSVMVYVVAYGNRSGAEPSVVSEPDSARVGHATSGD